MISILLGSGFEETEAIVVFDLLKRGGLDVAMVSVTGSLGVTSARGLKVEGDYLLDDVMDKKHQVVIIPGGMGGVKRILTAPSIRGFLERQAEGNAILGAICAGPLVLDRFGLLDGRRYTCYPGVEEELQGGLHQREAVVIDGPLVTSCCPGTATAFALALVEILLGESVRLKIERDWNGQ